MGRNGSPSVPAKEAFRIGEVAALTKVEPYVLRFWESAFPALRPTKTPSGQRLYRREDIETVLHIKRLLYEQGFTIAGARKRLESATPSEPPAAAPARIRGNGKEAAAREELRGVREELARLLTLLSSR